MTLFSEFQMKCLCQIKQCIVVTSKLNAPVYKITPNFKRSLCSSLLSVCHDKHKAGGVGRGKERVGMSREVSLYKY